MNREALALSARYDRLSRTLEREAIARLDKALDESFRALEREFLRAYPQIQSQGSLLATQQRAVLLNDLSGLLQIIDPSRQAEYEQLFERLIRGANGLGAEMAGDMIRAIAPESFVRTFTNPNLEAAALQARDGVRRLYRYNDAFIDRASAAVEQGLIQGWGPRRVATILRDELGVARFNAERIARTETLSALNDSAQSRYRDAGIEGVQLIVSIGEVCPICVARSGNVYAVGSIRVPIHPLCRCVLAPWSTEWQALGLTDDEFTRQYREQRIADLEREGKSPDYRVGPFERMAKLEQPPSPIWTP